jgi:hypothetical protein
MLFKKFRSDVPNKTLYVDSVSGGVSDLESVRGNVRAMVDGQLVAAGKVTEMTVNGEGRVSLCIKIVDKDVWGAIQAGEFTTVIPTAAGLYLGAPGDGAAKFASTSVDQLRKLGESPGEPLSKYIVAPSAEIKKLLVANMELLAANAALRAQLAAEEGVKKKIDEVVEQVGKLKAWLDEPVPAPWQVGAGPRPVPRADEREKEHQRHNEMFARRGY